jgi:hypothetical protein
LFALIADAADAGLTLLALAALLVLAALPTLLAVALDAAPSPEPAPYGAGIYIGPPTGMPGPFHPAPPVGAPTGPLLLPPRSALTDRRPCSNELPRPLALLVPVLPAAVVLPLAVEVLVVPAEARLLPMSETMDCKLAKRLDIKLLGLMTLSVGEVGVPGADPLGDPTPTDPAPPDTLPNDSNWAIRPLESEVSAPPGTALPDDAPVDAPVVDGSAENAVAGVPADPLDCVAWAAACEARIAASCAQRSFCPCIALIILSLPGGASPRKQPICRQRARGRRDRSSRKSASGRTDRAMPAGWPGRSCRAATGHPAKPAASRPAPPCGS